MSDGRSDPTRRARDEEDYLMQAVLGYLSECPEAMDSLEGIAEFWVMHNLIRVELNRLSRALQRLVDCGVLEEVGRKPNCAYRLKSITGLTQPNSLKQ